jgi:hypothetical protein
MAIAVCAAMAVHGAILAGGYLATTGIYIRLSHRRNGMRIHHWERHQASGQSVRFLL